MSATITQIERKARASLERGSGLKPIYCHCHVEMLSAWEHDESSSAPFLPLQAAFHGAAGNECSACLPLAKGSELLWCGVMQFSPASFQSLGSGMAFRLGRSLDTTLGLALSRTSALSAS